jgi:hypothetical protein
MASMTRKGRRYLRSATSTSHEVQVFLDENPMVASGLATVGSLIMNAVMQSKYGPMMQELMNPGSAPAASAAAGADAPATPAMPKAPKGKAASKKGRTLKRVAKKVGRKKATRKKVAKKAA